MHIWEIIANSSATEQLENLTKSKSGTPIPF
jgi:hypothetical protein